MVRSALRFNSVYLFGLLFREKVHEHFDVDENIYVSLIIHSLECDKFFSDYLLQIVYSFGMNAVKVKWRESVKGKVEPVDVESRTTCDTILCPNSY